GLDVVPEGADVGADHGDVGGLVDHARGSQHDPADGVLPAHRPRTGVERVEVLVLGPNVDGGRRVGRLGDGGRWIDLRARRVAPRELSRLLDVAVDAPVDAAV